MQLNIFNNQAIVPIAFLKPDGYSNQNTKIISCTVGAYFIDSEDYFANEDCQLIDVIHHLCPDSAHHLSVEETGA